MVNKQGSSFKERMLPLFHVYRSCNSKFTIQVPMLKSYYYFALQEGYVGAFLRKYWLTLFLIVVSIILILWVYSAWPEPLASIQKLVETLS